MSNYYSVAVLRNEIFKKNVFLDALADEQLEQIATSLNEIKPILNEVFEYEQSIKKVQGPCIRFGKYKGQPIKTLPETYVKWIIEKSNLYDTTKEFIKNVYYDIKPSSPTN